MVSMWFEFALLAFCLIFAASFSAAEAIFTTIGEFKAKQYLATKEREVKILEFWLKHPNRVINTILLGKTVFLVTSLVLATYLAIKLFTNTAVVGIIAVMIVVVLFFIEIVPKIFANNNFNSMSVFSLRLIRGLFYVIYPLATLLITINKKITKIFGSSGHVEMVTAEDLAYLIGLSEEQGFIEEQKQKMLSNIFDMSDMQVKEIMVPRTAFVAISHNITKEELLDIIDEHEYSRIPVYKDSQDNIIGILHIKSIVKLMKGGEWDMGQLISQMHEPFFIPETKKIDALLKEFQQSRQHMAVVVDEYGGVEGIITMEDILEEIVGDIWDEHDDDEDEHEIVQISPDHYTISARVYIDDLCDYFKLERTDDMLEYDTLAGLVFHVAGEIPTVGDAYIWRGFEIVVKEMNHNKLESIDFIRLVKAQEVGN